MTGNDDSPRHLLAVLRYNLDALGRAPDEVLGEVEPDIREVADLIIPAAKYVEDRRPGGGATDAQFLPPPSSVGIVN